ATRIAVTVEDRVDVLAITRRRRLVSVGGLLPEHIETALARARRQRPVCREVNHGEGRLRVSARPVAEVSGLPGGLPPSVTAGDRPPKRLVHEASWLRRRDASSADDYVAVTGNTEGLRAALARLDHHARHLAQPLETGPDVPRTPRRQHACYQADGRQSCEHE